MAERARNQMNASLFDELQQAAVTSARERMKPKVDYAKARLALGLEPEEPKKGAAGLAK
jgi:hypothetical protein